MTRGKISPRVNFRLGIKSSSIIQRWRRRSGYNSFVVRLGRRAMTRRQLCFFAICALVWSCCDVVSLTSSDHLDAHPLGSAHEDARGPGNKVKVFNMVSRSAVWALDASITSWALSTLRWLPRESRPGRKFQCCTVRCSDSLVGVKICVSV